MDGRKYCKKCDSYLPILNFSPNPKIKSGLSSWCKKCRFDYNQAHKKIKISLVQNGLKRCTRPLCSQINPQPIENFAKDSSQTSGLQCSCKTCKSEQSRLYHIKNPKKRKKRAKEYAKTHREYINAHYRKKRQEDPMFRVAANLRRATGGFIKNRGLRKTQKLNEYLGCTSQEFKKYLESLWKPGMTWDNYGMGNDKWNIDHKIPLASANTVEELYKLSHYLNLQPMWQPENIAKSDKMPIPTDSPKIT